MSEGWLARAPWVSHFVAKPLGLLRPLPRPPARPLLPEARGIECNTSRYDVLLRLMDGLPSFTARSQPPKSHFCFLFLLLWAVLSSR